MSVYAELDGNRHIRNIALIFLAKNCEMLKHLADRQGDRGDDWRLLRGSPVDR